MIPALDNTGITNFILMKALEDATINGVKIFDRIDRIGEHQLIAVKRDKFATRIEINIKDMSKG